MRLKRLNDAGIKRLEDFLYSLKNDSSSEKPESLLDDPTMSETLQVDIDIESEKFGNRFEAARYLNEKLSDSGLANIEKDRGLWAWLSLYYFDVLCPIDKSGKRNPGATARWVPEVNNFRTYYRHLLAGPYRIYRAHLDSPNSALVLLCGPVSNPGDIVEQLASRQELVTNKAILETAKILYLNTENLQPRRGAAGKGRGSVRRLADILNQFDLTWDLYSMNCLDLLKMLPREFDKFRNEVN